ncbi:MAG TPA: conjugative transposon protein TraM [Pseudosphingobacterium sp.]|nr:conjugative transposon protein TraM [Pseudosphingobacterium sp.]
MEQVKMSKQVKKDQQKKFFTFLPLIVIPFLIAGFHVYGGGGGKTENKEATLIGLNTSLPGAKNKDDSATDKLGFYSQADRDSVQRKKQQHDDPYATLSWNGEELLSPTGQTEKVDQFSLSPNGHTADANEEKIYRKIAEINKTISQPEPAAVQSSQQYQQDNQEVKEDIARLEEMMQRMQNGGKEEDPEMEQINSTLESILDIQHPERVQERLRKTSEQRKGQVFSVSTFSKATPVTLLDNRKVKDYAEEYNKQLPAEAENAFYSIKEYTSTAELPLSVEAVVHDNQTLVNGATVKLRLLASLFINGVLIPKDNFVYGTASLKGERLEIEVGSIRYENALFPVQLAVYDMDGISGIRIPGAITRDVAKQSGSQTISGFSPGTLDPSLGAQAASAGIELSKNLLSRKIKLIKVEVKAGYKVLLKDEKKRENQ